MKEVLRVSRLLLRFGSWFRKANKVGDKKKSQPQLYESAQLKQARIETIETEKEEKVSKKPTTSLLKLAHYQSVQKFNKLLTIVLISLSVIIVSLTLVIAKILPVKEKYPVFVQASEDSTNYVFVKTGINSNKATLISAALTKYILDRESIDIFNKERRIIDVRALHSPNATVDNQFMALINSINYQVLEKNARRDVSIISENELYKDKVAKFRITVVDRSLKTYESIYRADFSVELSYEFSNLVIASKNENRNPLGIIITNYSRVAL